MRLRLGQWEGLQRMWSSIVKEGLLLHNQQKSPVEGGYKYGKILRAAYFPNSTLLSQAHTPFFPYNAAHTSLNFMS